MENDENLLPIATLLLGAILTFVVTWLNGLVAYRRERARDTQAEGARRSAAGREHAARALAIIRAAESKSWERSPETGMFDIEVDDLNLEEAEAEIDLIPDAVLRERLAGALRVVMYPHTLSNSSYSLGYDAQVQRRTLWLLRQALAAYVREEPTHPELDELGRVAAANRDAQRERAEWDEGNKH